MDVLLFGATGMVGQGMLRECLRDPMVGRVVTVGRRATGQTHPKLRELTVPDLHDLSAIADQLAGFDLCAWCLGVTSAGLTEAEYARTTHDLTVEAAAVLLPRNPAMTFVFVSGAGTDATERGRVMWARVKGRTENALLRMPFRAVYAFRPGVIQPMHGIRSRTAAYRILYTVLGPIVPFVRARFPGLATSTEQMARAMLGVAARGYRTRVLETRDINAVS